MSGRKILITGGAGFIGSNLADAYLERGDRVWVVDDLSTGKRENVAPSVELVQMNIGAAGLDKLFASVGGFDIVNHHAAQADVRFSVQDPRNDARINIDGFLNVVESAIRHGTKRVLFVSSGGVVYGEPDVRPTPEDAPKRPLSPYGVSKLTGEHYLYYYAHVHGLEYAALRYSNVYGPRQDPHGEAGVVAIFCNRLLAGAPITIFGDGEQTRDYVYVGDVVQANMLLSEATLEPPVTLDSRAYNVGTGVETSVNELADVMMAAVGTVLPKAYAPARPGELLHSSLDAGRLRALGWSPRTTLRTGLTETYEHIAGQEVSA